MNKRSDFLVGINLGGWLVLEKWLTPSVFARTDASDEFTFMQTPGAKEKLRRHQREFIREKDFRWLNEHGVNAVRIPVGYWILEGDAPYIAAPGRLKWALDMAAKYDIKVLICLHGAAGSQNGHDHSGQIGKIAWQTSENLTKTKAALRGLARKFGAHRALFGIELLNEPQPKLFNRKLRQFYRAMYDELDAILPARVNVVFSDAFTPRLMSGVLRGKSRAVMDIHWYHFLLPRYTPLWLYFRIIKARAYLLRRLRFKQPVIIGEWSSVLRHETFKNMNQAQREKLVARHITLQQTVYQNCLGSFYWTYKMESKGGWNFRDMVEKGELKLPTRPQKFRS